MKKLAYRRNAGDFTESSYKYTNLEDVTLLNKLGYQITPNQYLFLDRGDQQEDIYSYVEKVAGVSKEVSKAIDKGESFSAEYLKDLDYDIPKGYEVKGDLCVPVEKVEQSFQQKKAFTIVDSPQNVIASAGKLVSDTYGRIASIPEALITGQEKFLTHLKGADKDLIEKSLEKSKNDERLKDVIVRLNHFDPVEDIGRLMSNKGIASKIFGTLALPGAWTQQLIRRSNNYNPTTNTIHLYSGIPEIAHHELGHAKDFNETKNTAESRMLANFIEAKILGKVAPELTAGPLTQMYETNANVEAKKTYDGDMREFRRRLWPARATYIGAGLSGLALSVPGVREKYVKTLRKILPKFKPTDSKMLTKLKQLAYSPLALMGVSALGGRLAAEAVNLYKSDQKPDTHQLEEMLNKQANYKWYNSKDLHRDVTDNRHYPFSYLTGEAKELIDAVKNRDWENFKEEIGDTTYAAQMLAAQATGLNHPVYADLKKFYDRKKVWEDLFAEKGGIYHPRHMQAGSNYAKASKIIKALQSAGIKVNQTEAERLANKYTGGKMEKEAATRWKRELRQGTLGVNNLKKIMAHTGRSDLMGSAENLHRAATSNFFRKGLATPINARDTVNPFAAKAYQHALKFRDWGRNILNQIPGTEKYRPQINSTWDALFQKLKPNAQFTENQMYDARKSLTDLSQSLNKNKYIVGSNSNLPGHKLYAGYREVLNRNYNPFAREDLPNLAQNASYAAYPHMTNQMQVNFQDANNAAVHGGYYNPNKITHTKWEDKDVYKNQSIKGFLDFVNQNNLPSPYAHQNLRYINSPVGIGNALTRHELGHVAFGLYDKQRKMQTIKRLHDTVRRYPALRKALLGADDINTYLDEGVAQVIGGSGNSRSAKRFNNDYIQFINENPQTAKLKEMLPQILQNDNSGLDAAILGQLAGNYRLNI